MVTDSYGSYSGELDTVSIDYTIAILKMTGSREIQAGIFSNDYLIYVIIGQPVSVQFQNV